MPDRRTVLALIAHDWLDKHPHDPDIQAVQRVCTVHDVPPATNAATAKSIIAPEAV